MHKEYKDIINIVKKTNRDAWGKGYFKGLERAYSRTWITDAPSKLKIPEDAKIIICYTDMDGSKLFADIATWRKVTFCFSLVNDPSRLIPERRVFGWTPLPSTQQFEDLLKGGEINADI